MVTSVRRLALLPGLRPLRRGRDRWQFGLQNSRLVAADPCLDQTLSLLERGEALPANEATQRCLDKLEGLVIDPARLSAVGIADGDLAALAARDPALLPERLHSRQLARVALRGNWPVDPEPLLSSAGLSLSETPTMVLVLSLGEPARELVDPLVREGLPHLLLRLVEGAATIGPFVVPGQTACLRCLDAHQAHRDPHHRLMVARHAASSRRDGVAEPVDSALATLAVAWAVRDLVTYAEADRPTSWSTTIRLAPGLSEISDVLWRRHPACGCAWPGTMEA